MSMFICLCGEKFHCGGGMNSVCVHIYKEYIIFASLLISLLFLMACFAFLPYELQYEIMELTARFFSFSDLFVLWSLSYGILLFAFKIRVLYSCLFDRHCPFVIEAITALAELGSTAKDIISLFPQVC